MLFNETILSYAPTRVGIGVLFVQSFQASAARTCARVCAVNVNHEEGLLQPCETIASVTGFKCGREMVNQKILCTKHLYACVGVSEYNTQRFYLLLSR